LAGKKGRLHALLRTMACGMGVKKRAAEMCVGSRHREALVPQGVSRCIQAVQVLHAACSACFM